MISQRRPDLCPFEHTNVDLVARAAALRRVHPSRLDGDEFRIDPRPSPTSRCVAVEVGGNSRCIRAVPAALAALPVPAVFVGARRVKLGMVLNSCPFLSVRDQSSCGCCLPCSHIVERHQSHQLSQPPPGYQGGGQSVVRWQNVGPWAGGPDITPSPPNSATGHTSNFCCARRPIRYNIEACVSLPSFVRVLRRRVRVEYTRSMMHTALD